MGCSVYGIWGKMSFLLKKSNHLRGSERGFSFFEIVMVLFIAGMIIGPAYSIIFNTLGLGTNEDRMETISIGMAEHYRVFGRLPIPADLDAAPGDADFADEALVADLIATPGVTVGKRVLIGAIPIQALREAMGCVEPGEVTGALPWQLNIFRNRLYDWKDRLANGDAVNANYRNNQAEVYGCITRHHLLDEFDNKFVYAVTEDVTNTATFDPTSLTVGQIQILNAGGGAATVNNQWFVIVSPGEDKKGAFREDGTQSLCVAGIKDSENCDGDRVFVSQPPNDVAGAEFFDDRVDYSLAGSMRENDFWGWRDNGGGTPDITFNPQSRLIITNNENMTYDTNDALVINEGNVLIDVDPVSTDGGTIEATDVMSQADIEANQNVEAKSEFYGSKYCYGTCP